MNVLVLATKYLGIGGVEAVARCVARAVAGGREVDVLSLLEGEAGRSGDDHPGRYLGAQGTRPTLWAYVRLAVAAMRRGSRYDLVICGHVAVAPIGLALHRGFRTPYICIAHGIEVWGPLGPMRGGALHGAARIIATSEFTAGRLVTTHGIARDRIKVVYPPLDPVLIGRADREDALAGEGRAALAAPLTLLTVARLSAQERYKGCDTVIQALPSVIAETGPLRYVIVGDGDDRPRLEALAERAGVRASVDFRGHVTREELATHYRACDIFVMPSVTEHRPDGWTGEGFGIVYIEAAAFGRPVVAGNGGGAPEAVQDGVTGYVVDGRDMHAVAAAITRLGTDEQLRARMGAAGRQWARSRFTFDRFRGEIGAVVDAALSASAIPSGPE